MAQMMMRQMNSSRCFAECSSARITKLLDTAVLLVVSFCLVGLRVSIAGLA